MKIPIPRAFRTLQALPVLLPSAAILLLGLLFLSGVVVNVGGKMVGGWHLQQFSGVLLGLAVGAAALLIPYKVIVQRAYLLYALNLGMLLLVLKVGPEINNARRWFPIGGVQVQPSEFMKLTLVLTLARYIRFRTSYQTFAGLGTPFLLTIVPMALVIKQPDLGTALICLPILFAMLFVAGARLRHLLAILLLGAAMVYPVYRYGLHDYQRKRIDALLHMFQPEPASSGKAKDHVQNEGYQLDRSMMAIGSGGLFGKGLGEGQVGAAGRVPERHTDFIFAVVGHESGFAGSLLLLVLLLVLLLGLLQVAFRSRDPAGRLICVGVFALFGFQAFVNLAMTVGLLPVTGLTLPFLSYGRSSLVTSMAAIALVWNVASRPSFEFGRTF